MWRVPDPVGAQRNTAAEGIEQAARRHEVRTNSARGNRRSGPS